MTLKDTTAAISLPGSPGGISPSRSPDGETARSGPEAVHVSRFRARDNERAMPTNDTSGPLFTALSPSADLQRSLENRLQARMAGSGSPLFVLTWSDWDMPAGVLICRLRASGRRTSDSGYGGWPTPRSQEDGRTLEQYGEGRRRGYPNRKGKTSGGPSSRMGGQSIAAQLVD